jgi:hypothetical protein
VGNGGGANSLVRFWLERGDDEALPKDEAEQRAPLDSMERKRDMARQRDDIVRMRGSIE